MEEKIKLEDHDLSQPVIFKILTEMETKIGKDGYPVIKLGMKCTNKIGQEFDGWFNHILWGSEKGKPDVQNFLDSLDNKISIEWDGDSWSGYDSNKPTFKFLTGKCYLKTKEYKGKIYYNIDRFIEKEVTASIEEPKQEQIKENIVTDEDIPF